MSTTKSKASGNSSSGSQNKQSDRLSEEDKAKQAAGKADKSSHDHTSRVKASTGEGAGGGAKQKQNH